jgi:hypothetical protein
MLETSCTNEQVNFVRGVRGATHPRNHVVEFWRHCKIVCVFRVWFRGKQMRLAAYLDVTR